MHEDQQPYLSEPNKRNEPDHYKLVTKAEVEENDSIMLPTGYIGLSTEYLQKALRPDDQLAELKNIISKAKTNSSLPVAKTPYISPSSFPTNPFDTLDFDTDASPDKIKKGRLIEEPAILLSTVGDPKIALFKADNPVILSPTIDAWTLETTKIIPEYFWLEFHQEYFQKQLKGFIHGTVVSRISPKDF
ncbi:MAG: hypothetical protein IPL46_13430 [Saprospiraceae bacterium]|nr:hypothetical protein [Saprospiraceae bacterium]